MTDYPWSKSQLIPFSERDVSDIQGRIANFERVNALSLPKDYRDFLAETNGGAPPSTWESDVANGVPLIAYFYGMTGNPSGVNGGDDYQMVFDIYVKSKRVPPKYVPIACDPFGNLYLLSIGESSSAVVCWDREDDDYKSVVVGDPIASSFTDFYTMYLRGMR